MFSTFNRMRQSARCVSLPKFVNQNQIFQGTVALLKVNAYICGIKLSKTDITVNPDLELQKCFIFSLGFLT